MGGLEAVPLLLLVVWLFCRTLVVLLGLCVGFLSLFCRVSIVGKGVVLATGCCWCPECNHVAYRFNALSYFKVIIVL